MASKKLPKASSPKKNLTESGVSKKREIVSGFVMGEEDKTPEMEKEIPPILAPAQTKVIAANGTTEFAFHLQTEAQLKTDYMEKIRRMSQCLTFPREIPYYGMLQANFESAQALYIEQKPAPKKRYMAMPAPVIKKCFLEQRDKLCEMFEEAGNALIEKFNRGVEAKRTQKALLSKSGTMFLEDPPEVVEKTIFLHQEKEGGKVYAIVCIISNHSFRKSLGTSNPSFQEMELEQLGVWIKLAGPKGGSFIYEVPQSKKLYCESGGLYLGYDVMWHLLSSDELLRDLTNLFAQADRTLARSVLKTPGPAAGAQAGIVSPATTASALLEHHDPIFHKVAREIMAINSPKTKGTKRKSVEEVEVENEDQSEVEEIGDDNGEEEQEEDEEVLEDVDDEHEEQDDDEEDGAEEEEEEEEEAEEEQQEVRFQTKSSTRGRKPVGGKGRGGYSNTKSKSFSPPVAPAVKKTQKKKPVKSTQKLATTQLRTTRNGKKMMRL